MITVVYVSVRVVYAYCSYCSVVYLPPVLQSSQCMMFIIYKYLIYKRLWKCALSIEQVGLDKLTYWSLHCLSEAQYYFLILNQQLHHEHRWKRPHEHG